MLRQILAVTALAGAFGTAQAGSLLETVQHSAEVPFSLLDLPASEGGILKFAVCEGCEIHTVLMSGSTQYLVNNRPVPFEDFAATVASVEAEQPIANRSLVGLYFDAASKRLVRIALVAPLQ